MGKEIIKSLVKKFEIRIERPTKKKPTHLSGFSILHMVTVGGLNFINDYADDHGHDYVHNY